MFRFGPITNGNGEPGSTDESNVVDPVNPTAVSVNPVYSTSVTGCMIFLLS
jgi:hypothetical protein